MASVDPPHGPRPAREDRPALWRPRALAILIPAVLAAIAALVALQLRSDWRQLLEEVSVNSTTITRILAEHADRLLESADLVRLQTEAIVDADANALTDPSFETHLQLSRFVEAIPHVASIWVGDATGDAVLTSRQFPAPPLNAADRDYFTSIRDDPDHLFIGSLPDNRYADQVLIITSRRLPDDDGAFRGFVQVSIEPYFVQAVFRRVQLAHQASLWWLAPDGRPLLREPHISVDRLDELLPDGVDVAGQSAGSFTARSKIDGSDRLFHFARSSKYGNVILLGIERQALTAIWWQRASPTLALGALLLGAVGTILAFIWREQTRTRAYARELEGAVAARTRDLQDSMTQKELILQEMRHRVGNAYTTIQALSQQMLRSSDDLAAFRETFPRRLRSLARTQTMLVAAENRGAELEDLVWLELEPYRDRGDPGMAVSGPPVALDARRASAAGLILHELVTNAVKHGALSVPDGRLEVRWRTDGPRLVLDWKERAGPPLPQSRPDGFGSGMMQRAAALCDGSIELRYPPEGLEARFVLPL
jgi:two-component sensor histidine kinase